jgi:MerR family regulatory protein
MAQTLSIGQLAQATGVSAKTIRYYEKLVVIAQNPYRTYSLHGSHRDHRIAGGVVLDASTRSRGITWPSRSSCPSTSRTRCARSTAPDSSGADCLRRQRRSGP